jgi:hypothetical protein
MKQLSIGIFGLCLAVAGSCAQDEAQVIAMQGQSIPGLNGLTASAVSPHGVSADGHILYQMVPSNSANGGALLTWHNGIVRAVVKQGDPSSGFVTPSVFAGFSVARIDDAGKVAIQANLQNGSEGVWRETSPGTMQFVLSRGGVVPVSSYPVTARFSVIKQLWLASDGGISFVGDITGTTIGTRALFSKFDDTFTTFARQGDPALMFGGNASFFFGSSTTEFIMAGRNRVGIFRTFANGINLGWGPPDSVQALLRTGTQAPGLALGRTLSQSQNVTIGDDGTAAFTANLNNPSGVALFVGTPNSLAPVAVAGDPVPGWIGLPTILTSFPVPLNQGYPSGGLAVGPAGHVVFAAAIALQSSPGNTRTALFIREPQNGAVTLIAATNTPFGIPSTSFTSFKLEQINVNARGDVVFAAQSSQGDMIIGWTKRSGLEVLARVGTLVRVNTSSSLSIAAQPIGMESSLSQLAPFIPQSYLADDGTFAFVCRLSNNAVAVVAKRIPRTCDSIDFNNNTVFPEDQDVIDFFNVLAGGPCSPGNTCSDIDFNNNGIFPEDQDVIDFFNVLAGGTCP